MNRIGVSSCWKKFSLRRGAAIVAAGAVLTLAGGCGRRETPVSAGLRTQTLRMGEKNEPRDLDPQIATDTTEFAIIKALMEGLTEIVPATSQAGPGVAERWETSADGRTWTFHLRATARWSNGDPVTADDFVYGLRRVLTPALGAEYATQLSCLAGAEDFLAGRLTDFSAVGVRAADARTLVFSLREPVPYLPAMLVLPVWFPAHRPTIEKFGAEARRGTAWTRAGNFVGNGAFVLAEWRQNQIVRVTRSDTYWDRARVTLQAVEFFPVENAATQEAMFRAGQLHLTSGAIPADKLRAYKSDPVRQALVFETPLLATKFFRFNCDRPPLNDGRVRRALALAIDREKLVRRVMQNELAAVAFTPPDCAGYTPERGVAFDPGAARRLLAEAGFPGGAGVPRLELLFYQTGDSGQPAAEAVQEMWRTGLGIDVALASQETKTVLDRRRAQTYDILLSEWFGDYLDPTTFLDLWKNGAPHNKTGWSSAEYDRLLGAAAVAPEPPARFALLRRAEAQLLAEAPITPLFHTPSRRLRRPEVKGWQANLLELHPLKDVRLEP